MPSLNMTLDASSPLIAYKGDWSQQQIANDSHGSFSFSETRNTSATFNFAGKWVRVMGSKNKFHGDFTVSVDGQAYDFNGATPDDTLFTSIFSQNLPNDNHTMVIRNSADMTLNIQSIDWACDIGPQSASNSSIQTSIVDDADPSFAYFPEGAWSMKPTNLSSFVQQTGHSTSIAEAAVNFKFSGDAIAIYGTTGPGHAQYRVSGPAESISFNAERPVFSSDVLLFFASGFGAGNHTVTLSTETSGLLQIDSAKVFSAARSAAPSPSPLMNSPSGKPTIPPDPALLTNFHVSNAAIIGISFTATVMSFLVVAIWLLLRRNKRLWMRLQRGYMVQSQFDPHSPPTGVTPLMYRPQSPEMRQTAPRRLSNIDRAPQTNVASNPIPTPTRAGTMASDLTSSTLVAEAGSDVTRVASRFGLKPLRLVSRWTSSSGTPSSAALPSPQHSEARRPSRQPSPWIRPDSEFYDPFAAVMAEYEDQPDDILRHPIQRHERGAP